MTQNTRERRSGFTLIELMIAMLLMSMVTATCIWVFRQSLGIYNKSTGNAEVNQNWRIAMEKINQDLSACLPLSSGEQRFLMINRFADDDEFGRSFPRDYLSFTTTTRILGDTTTALVSYDIVETASKLPILMRYVTKVDDLTTLAEPLENNGGVYREVLAEYCTMFRIEYLWEDPRPVGTVVPEPGDASFKQIEDPGIFMTLHPDINEDPAGLNAAGTDRFTGGLNGTSVLQNPDSSLHAGAGTSVLEELYTSYLYDSSASSIGIIIPFRNQAGFAPEPFTGSPGMINRQGSTNTGVSTLGSLQYVPAGIGARNRVILIMSPNLWPGSNMDPSDTPLDITANFGVLGGTPADFPTDFDPLAPAGTYYHSATNETLYPTYVPAQLRITMKIYNKSRTSIITRSKTFWIPSSGS